MSIYADRIFDLLLTSTNDPAWVQLLKELNLEARPLGAANRRGAIPMAYERKGSGVSLYGDQGIILTAHFHVGAEFPDDLPFGLKAHFTIEDVRATFGEPESLGNPQAEGFGVENFRVGDCRICVWFWLADRKLYDIRLLRTVAAVSSDSPKH